jgi:hypothetical protein
MSHERTGFRSARGAVGFPRQRLLLAVLVVSVLVAGGYALPARAAAQQGAQLTVGVFCADGGVLGTFVVTLTRGGMPVGGPRTLRCGGPDADTTFGDLAPGAYTVIETAGPGTDLANYQTFWRCDGEFRSGTSFTVDLAAGGQATCGFLNRLVRTGILELRKECRGRSTEGRFRLELDGRLEFAIGCGAAEVVRLPPGSYSIVEMAGPGTDLAAYATVTLCRTVGQPWLISIGGARVDRVVVLHEDVTVCTITNIYLRPF